MKILFYNWCPLSESEGGGITIYQNNLLNYLAETDNSIESFFLCSGFYYNNKKKSYIREEKVEKKYRVFSIVNSPVYAPMRAPADNFQRMIDDETLPLIIKEFLIQNGPFDVIHFQTLEGLSLNVLNLKSEFPNTKFVFSLHNYTAFCPNVMLWTESNNNCYLNQNKQKCEDCMQRYSIPPTRFLLWSRKISDSKHEKLYYISRGIKFLSRKYLPVNKKKNSKVYNLYISESIKSINKNIDIVLAVSKRVKEIAVNRGIDKSKVFVSYIGTKFADTAIYHNKKNPYKNPFTVVYMGYMRVEKGFYFFLDCLDNIDPDISKNIELIFATKITDVFAKRRIENLAKKFAKVTLYDGYTHEDISKILANAHLGVVPVLWEDNLPQIAIEMISNGVPVLTSNLGGANELNNSESFIFIGGNHESFIQKLKTLYNDRNRLVDYWNNSVKLTTIEEHIRFLKKIYSD